MREIIDDLISKNLISTCTIVDVLDGLQITNKVITSKVSRVTSNKDIVVGKAYTVSWTKVRKSNEITKGRNSTWEEVRDFVLPSIEKSDREVYVSGGGELIENEALLGGLSSTYLKNINFEGAVIGGALRDYNLLSKLNFPVDATGYSPIDTQGAYRVDSIGQVCVINNVVINTGDWVFSDMNGVVIVPQEYIEKVISMSITIEEKESGILKQIREGKKLSEIVDSVGRI